MVFFVAEIGVNWDGDFDLLTQMVTNAKKAGCDAVKFQAFNEETVKEHREKARLLQASVSKNNIQEIDKITKSVGIEWFCTPMYPEAVDLLDSFVRRFKIREYDGRVLLENKRTKLLDAIFKTEKEIIISSQKLPQTNTSNDMTNVSWLYCVPKYPCKLSDLDFSNLKEFDGFSNHCPNYIAPLTAAILGSKIIEVHVTQDKNKDFIDNNISFDFNELENLINSINQSEKISK